MRIPSLSRKGKRRLCLLFPVGSPTLPLKAAASRKKDSLGWVRNRIPGAAIGKIGEEKLRLTTGSAPKELLTKRPLYCETKNSASARSCPARMENWPFAKSCCSQASYSRKLS